MCCAALMATPRTQTQQVPRPILPTKSPWAYLTHPAAPAATSGARDTPLRPVRNVPQRAGPFRNSYYELSSMTKSQSAHALPSTSLEGVVEI